MANRHPTIERDNTVGDMHEGQDLQQQLFGLLEVADTQQHAVDSALNGLKHLHGNLVHAVADLETVGKVLPASVEKAAAQSVAGTLKAHLDTISAAMMRVQAIAFSPLLAQLKEATATALTADQALKNRVTHIETALQRAETRFGWRWAWVVSIAISCAIVALAGAAWSVVWWQRDQVESLLTEKEQVLTEIEQGRAMLAQLTKKTGGVSYQENSQGRFVVVPRGYETKWSCNGEAETPCIRLK